uniref:Ig-like domain-containing protein n=1 Tax=Neogobius melanostomus TaxID=47308 RepID=A0A8C6SC38_9GOBI
ISMARMTTVIQIKLDVFAQTACPAFLMFVNAAFVSDTTVELPCLCKPQEVQTVVWFYRKHMSSSEQTQALTDDHGMKVVNPDSVPHSADLKSRFSIRMFSLIIFRTSTADSGVYICGSEHRDFFYAYDLDIQEARKITFSKPEPPYRTFTSFQAWSVCDRCGPPGEQVRVGLCYVHSPYLHVRYRRANQTVVSCGSGAVLRVFGPIGGEGASLEVRKCEEVLYYLSHRADTVLTMGCPGARPNMAVAWDRGDTPILRWEHTVQPGGEGPRISIDTGHHLPLRLSRATTVGQPDQHVFGGRGKCSTRRKPGWLPLVSSNPRCITSWICPCFRAWCPALVSSSTSFLFLLFRSLCNVALASKHLPIPEANNAIFVVSY